jgi:hypothetical protein
MTKLSARGPLEVQMWYAEMTAYRNLVFTTVGVQET